MYATSTYSEILGLAGQLESVAVADLAGPNKAFEKKKVLLKNCLRLLDLSYKITKSLKLCPILFTLLPFLWWCVFVKLPVSALHGITVYTSKGCFHPEI